MPVAGLALLVALALSAGPAWAPAKIRINWTAIRRSQSRLWAGRAPGGGGLSRGEYALLRLTEAPTTLVPLRAGRIDAGTLSPPPNRRARRSGLNELKNLAVDGPEYPSLALGSTRAYVKAHEDV